MQLIFGWTFTAWAAIGLLSGHMYLLIGGNRFFQVVHFQGLAALLLSLGILVIAGMQWMAFLAGAGRGLKESWHVPARVALWTLLLLCLAGAVIARESGWGGDRSFSLVSPELFVKAGRFAWMVRWGLPWLEANAMTLVYITAGAAFWTIVVMLLNAVRPVHLSNRRGSRERAILLAVGGVTACAGACLAAIAYLSAAADRAPTSVAGVALAYSVLVECAGVTALLVLGVLSTWRPAWR